METASSRAGSGSFLLLCTRLLVIRSEPEFGDELHLSGAHAGTADPPDVSWADQGVRQRERRMVGEIGGVGAELQIESLRKRKRLVKRRVDRGQSRSY